MTFQQDPVRFDSLVQKLTTGLAITRLTWECHDLQDQLAASTEANQDSPMSNAACWRNGWKGYSGT